MVGWIWLAGWFVFFFRRKVVFILDVKVFLGLEGEGKIMIVLNFCVKEIKMRCWVFGRGGWERRV